MKVYSSDKIKTIALIGHQGCGKTMLVEAILKQLNYLQAMGHPSKKNTVSDFLPEEQAKQSSLSSALVAVEYNDYKINFIDTPGNDELQNDVLGILRGCDAAVMVIDAQKGIEIGTERLWKIIKKHHIPALFFINKMDKENVKYTELAQKLKDNLGSNVLPLVLPIGEGESFKGFLAPFKNKGYVYDKGVVSNIAIPSEDMPLVLKCKQDLTEKAAETTEDLLEKFFKGEVLEEDEVKQALKHAIKQAELLPILFGSAEKEIGIDFLLKCILKYILPPVEKEYHCFRDEARTDEFVTHHNPNDPFLGLVIKTLVDPFLGTINLVKIFSGCLKPGQEIIETGEKRNIKISQLFTMQGKKQIEISEAYAGDVVCVTKLDLKTGTTLYNPKNPNFLLGAKYYTPIIYKAIIPKNKQDEDKISNAIAKLSYEDPSFEILRNKETAQLLIGGLGMSHIYYLVDRMKTLFKVEVVLEDQKIVYRETIKKKVEAEGKHKKQSGGAGQFGHVFIRFEPSKETFEFSEEIFGGAVPKNYFPAVEKGLIETFEHGPLGGFPVIFVKATLYDGSYHPVDSNEISFKLAAGLAFKEACKTCVPTLLEPIMLVKVTVKQNYVGDIMGDINKRRGRLLGTENGELDECIIKAEVPECEIISYAIDLKAMTQGSGMFKRTFLRYDEVPAQFVPKILNK